MVVIIGIIGGTGLDQDSSLLIERKLVDLEETPYGRASDTQAVAGLVRGTQVYIISRHGKQHDVSPSHVNYRANLWTLAKQLHCTHVLVTSACGSLQEHIQPGHIGILDQYIDRTSSFRDRSFYKVCHVEQRRPINETMQKMIEQACQGAHIPCHKNLTAVTIEGPRFSTLAESNLYRSWGCHVVNMTSVPEVSLAAELGVMYAAILLVTDYDCWRDDPNESVSSNLVLERMKDLGAKARKIIPDVICKISDHDWSWESERNARALENAIMIE